MTLVLSLVTKDCAFQVADRRLTRIAGNTAAIKDDDANKLIFFDGRISFGITGLGELAGKRTDLWLVDVLGNEKCKSLPDALKHLAQSATNAARRVSQPFRPLAFIATGWTCEAGGIARPILCRVSNFHDSTGCALASAVDRFSICVKFLQPTQRYLFEATGQSVPKNLTDKFARLARQLIKNRASRELTVNTMVKVVRSAAVKNQYIGKNLLSVVIPKIELPLNGDRRILLLDGTPDGNHATFQYWHAGRWHGINHGPHVVIPGGIRTTGLETGALGIDGKPVGAEDLGGMELRDRKPSRILFPCCTFFNELTDCLMSVNKKPEKEHYLAIFTDEDAVKRSLQKSEDQWTRIVLHNGEELARLIEATKGVAKVLLNPNSPREKRCFATDVKTFLWSLRNGRI